MPKPKPSRQPSGKREVDRSNLATKTDISDVRRGMAETKAELVRWVVGVGFAQVATILAVLKLFPAAHP